MKIIIFITVLLISSHSISSEKIVLIPGAFSSGDQLYLNKLTPFLGPIKQKKYFKHLQEKLENGGYSVLTCPKKKSRDIININQRARECSIFLFKHLIKNPKTKFHLFGHSMGGLVARKLIESRALSLFVNSVTTISTPHRGSLLVNLIFENLEQDNSFAKFLEFVDISPSKKKYLSQLKVENGQNIFSQNLKNPKKIPIYSISNYKDNYYNTVLAAPQRMIPEINDGIIETSSMKFGIHLGTIPADHMESICMMYTKRSKGCESSLELILKHFSAIHND